jgi:adenylate cyclase
VVFNAIMTGEVWRTLPPWATMLATLLAGLLAALAVSFLSPGKALVAVVALLGAYLAFDGLWLFDRHNLILGLAGPMVAVGAVWSGGTLAKLVIERWERARITRRFRSYVDFVEQNPDTNFFEGQVRELTVVFVDLVGFTKLTEAMGSDTVQLLNRLWAAVVPVMQRNDALVNKFLGDGVMFFYGAPKQSPRHARDAVATVLEVQRALAEFNAANAARGGNGTAGGDTLALPALTFRYGISTGPMVVGDAGGEDRQDYTVLGDYANLGARLESANKALGTVNLMTDRTVELAGDEFLFRPIGRLRVVGRQAATMTYEVLAPAAAATDAQKSLAAHTRAAVDAFAAGDFRTCLDALDRMDAAHGPSKLAALYRDRCTHCINQPATGPADCEIVLSEK